MKRPVAPVEKMIKHLWAFSRALLLFWISLIYCLSPTRAQETPPIAALFEAFPEAYKGADGNYQGTLVDITEVLSQGINHTIEKQITNWPRIIAGLGTEKFDIAYLFRVPAFEAKVHYLGRLGCLADLYVPRRGLKISGLQDLTGLRVGFLRNAAFHKATDEANHFEKLAVSDSESVMRLLVRDRVDVIVIHSGHYTRLRRTTEKPALYPDDWQEKLGNPSVRKLYEVEVTLSRKSSWLRQAQMISDAIRQLRAKGLFDKAMEKHDMPFWPCEDNPDSPLETQ